MTSATNALALIGAYARTMRLRATLRDRAAIDRWQRPRIEALRRHAVRNVDHYRRLGDVPFARFPVIGKAEVMGDFAAFNTLRLPAAEGWRRLEAGEPLPGFDIGCSTGTTGNRGLFVVSDRERFVWLGTIVAKAIPDLWARHRVVIILPRASSLYSAANESRLLKLHFAELADGLEMIREGIERFRPTVVVGPPRILRWLAEQETAIAPTRMFSAGEVLDPVDRAVIEEGFGLRLGQIYMATEGLFGVTCRHGTLHLAEDVVHFELEPVAGGLVSPVVTDFTRRTQVMARYRMNDLLRLDPACCPCGSPLRAVAEVVGRRDDAFDLPALGGEGRRSVSPDVLRNALLDADRRIADFRLRQTGPGEVALMLAPGMAAEVGAAARAAVAAALAGVGVQAEIALSEEELAATGIAKLRRIERRWQPER